MMPQRFSDESVTVTTKTNSAMIRMTRGSLAERYENIRRKDGETAKKGPYYMLTRTAAAGKAVSKRIPAAGAPA
jgi:hypothetical protein